MKKYSVEEMVNEADKFCKMNVFNSLEVQALNLFYITKIVELTNRIQELEFVKTCETCAVTIEDEHKCLCKYNPHREWNTPNIDGWMDKELYGSKGEIDE